MARKVLAEAETQSGQKTRLIWEIEFRDLLFILFTFGFVVVLPVVAWVWNGNISAAVIAVSIFLALALATWWIVQRALRWPQRRGHRGGVLAN